MFIDEVKVKLIAGRGGDGIVAFRRENMYLKVDQLVEMVAVVAV